MTDEEPSANDRLYARIGGLLVAFGWTCFMALFLVDFLWMQAAPNIPVPEKNLVVLHVEHGAGKYFSSGQEITTELMFAVIPLAILGAFIMPSFREALKTGKAFDGKFKLAKVDESALYRIFPVGAALALLFIFALYKVFTPCYP